MSGKFAYKDEFLYLTTVGWKSGQPHEIEIWYVAHGDCYYIVAEGRERAHWVRNIQRQPAVTVRVEGRSWAGRGRVVDAQADGDLTATVARLMEDRYGWSDGLIVELCPNAS